MQFKYLAILHQSTISIPPEQQKKRSFVMFSKGIAFLDLKTTENLYMKIYCAIYVLNHFIPIFHFYIPWKYQKNGWSDTFRGCRKRILVWHELRHSKQRFENNFWNFWLHIFTKNTIWSVSNIVKKLKNWTFLSWRIFIGFFIKTHQTHH